MEKFNWISVALAAIGTFFSYIFGGWDLSLAVLIAFIVLDYLTDILAAIVTKSLSSYIGARGIAKKALIFVVLIVAVLLDRLINNDQWIFRTLVCYFYIANEGISLIENVAKTGLPIPQKLRSILHQVKDDKD